MAKTINKGVDYYEFTQPNPTEGKKCTKGDCVIRAFAIASNKTWLESFDNLSKMAREAYSMPNSQEVYEKVFAQMGYKSQSVKVVKGQKRMTAKDFALSHPKGVFILRLAHHICAVVDGKIRDAWDCGRKCVYKVYVVK